MICFKPFQKRKRLVSCPESGGDAENYHADVGNREKICGTGAAAYHSDEPRNPTVFLPPDRTVLSGHLCIVF